MKLINRILISCLHLTRPILGPASCRFSPSCGKFAIQQLQEKKLFEALRAIGKQLLRCY